MAYNYEYPYIDPNRYNSDWELNTVKKLSDNIKDIYKELKEMIDALSNNNIIEKNKLENSYLGKKLNGINFKLNGMTGTLRRHELFSYNFMRISEVANNYVDFSFRGGKFRVNFDFTTPILCGEITRLLGYGFTQNNLYRYGGTIDGNYMTKAYINGLEVLDNTSGTSNIFNDLFIYTFFVFTRLNESDYRFLICDSSGIYIIRTYSHVNTPEIIGQYWSNVYDNDDFTIVSNPADRILMINNYTEMSMSITKIII